MYVSSAVVERTIPTMPSNNSNYMESCRPPVFSSIVTAESIPLRTTTFVNAFSRKGDAILLMDIRPSLSIRHRCPTKYVEILNSLQNDRTGCRPVCRLKYIDPVYEQRGRILILLMFGRWRERTVNSWHTLVTVTVTSIVILPKAHKDGRGIFKDVA